MNTKKIRQAFAYVRTSSAANVGEDKDSERRQLAAITSYAKRAGVDIVKGAPNAWGLTTRGRDVERAIRVQTASRGG